MRGLAFALVAALLTVVSAGAGLAQGRIVDAQAAYGVDQSTAQYARCQGVANVTGIIRAGCANRSSCRIPINNQAMRADPCKGQSKELIVSFSCLGGSNMQARCREYEYMLIACPSPQGYGVPTAQCVYAPELDND